MKPLLHAKISANKFGGSPEDYIEIHNWFDSTKAHVADARHRIILHNAFGIFLCEQTFGEIVRKHDGSYVRMPYITNSIGKQISVRDIAEQHVLDDMGCIPSLSDVLDKVGIIDESIVGGIKAKKAIVKMKIDPNNMIMVD